MKSNMCFPCSLSPSATRTATPVCFRNFFYSLPATYSFAEKRSVKVTEVMDVVLCPLLVPWVSMGERFCGDFSRKEKESMG
jgi:hypothetical protein